MRLPALKLPKNPLRLSLYGRAWKEGDGSASLSRSDRESIDELVRKYSLLATGEIIAIPVPGADVAAVFLTWARMIQEIGRAHGREISLADAKKLVWAFLLHGLSVGGAWFGSATVAQMILKIIPGAGRVVAYIIDATIAAASIGKITRSLALHAHEHFKTDGRSESGKDSGTWDGAFDRMATAAHALAKIAQGIRP